MIDNASHKKISILTSAEIKSLYGTPEFTTDLREQHFALSDEEIDVANSLERLETKVYFILLLGYFRARPVYHSFLFREQKDDVYYILERYFSGSKFPRGNVSKTSRFNLFNKVLAVRHYVKADKRFKLQLKKHMQDVSTIFIEPRYIFDECLLFYKNHRTVLNNYPSIRKWISEAINTERKRLENLIEQQLSRLTKESFKQLLNVKDNISQLAALRKNPKDFKKGELQKEVNNQKLLSPIYNDIKSTVEKLKLSRKNLRYYSSMVNYYNVSKLKRFSDNRTALYLTCFAYFRYQQINDNLITAFSYLVRKHKDNAKKYAEQQLLSIHNDLWSEVKLTLPFLAPFIDATVGDNIQLGKLRDRLFKELTKERLESIYHRLKAIDIDKKEYHWQYFDKKHATIATQIRPIFMCLDMELSDANTSFNKQISATKTELENNKKISTVDKRIFTNAVKTYLVTDDSVNVKRFEYFLYHRVNESINSGDIYITESEKYRQLEDDLIDKELWSKQSKQLIKKTGLSQLNRSIDDMLNELESQVEYKIKRACSNMLAGNNPFVILNDNKKHLKWSVAVKKENEAFNHAFFNYVPQADIAPLMAYVHQKTGFASAFKHIAASKAKAPLSLTDLFACIIADATNYGLQRLANISDRSFPKLRHIEESYLRIETLKESNDILSNAISELLIFQHYNVEDDKLYASIDGQKFETRINTFKARYSAKYFKEKGVSAMTLSCNHVALNTELIGANEYEGHWAFDLLYNNESEVDPDVLSTDQHGINQVNFAILNLFGYQFAPRYSHIKKVFNYLFEIIPDGSDVFIKLKTPINRKLIISEWNEIQRIIVSLSRKTITQATLIKKLSTLSQSNRTLAALREYDRLVKINYILEYIDDKTLRSYIQNVLNKGEAYHQLKRAIASVNGNQFRGGSDHQVELWNECSRLISNCIIYFNSAILSNLLKRFAHDEAMLKIITSVSPAAWQHINLNGTYNFEADVPIILDEMIANITSETFKESDEKIKQATQ